MVSDDSNIGELSLRYYGPALDVDHSLSVRDLAPALMNFAEAVDAAKQEIEPELNIELRVNATREGSFDIQFILQQIGEYSQTSAGKGLEFLGGIGVSALLPYIVKKIVNGIKVFLENRSHGKGKIISGNNPDDDDIFTEKKITIEYPDGYRMEAYESSMRIAHNPRFINNAGKAFAGPTNAEGINGVKISSYDEFADVDASTAKDMAEWAPAENILKENNVTMYVQPLDAHFEPNKKWHVTDGTATYSVDVHDLDFINKVEKGLRIGKLDRLKVTMHTVCVQEPSGKLKTTYSITRVESYTPYNPPEQNTLF